MIEFLSIICMFLMEFCGIDDIYIIVKRLIVLFIRVMFFIFILFFICSMVL